MATVTTRTDRGAPDARDRLRRLLTYLDAVRGTLEVTPGVPEPGEAAAETVFWEDELASLPGADLRHDGGPWLVLRRPALGRYRDLWDLALRLGQDEAALELVWGHGVLHDPALSPRRHPLLVTPVRADADADRGEVRVHPLTAATLELAFLDGLRVPGAPRLATLRDQVRGDPPDPWDRDRARGLYAAVAEALRAPGAAAVPVAGTSVLYARPRRVPYRRFYQLALDTLSKDPSVALATPLADLAAPDAAAPRPRRAAEGGRLLLPLPANHEQEEIARRLAGHRGVIVQGPPGTGKTHTIANLLAHLMAQGKRVLVTSHKEQPLQVLRGALPERIRPLCVSLLGADAGGGSGTGGDRTGGPPAGALGQLEGSVHAILRETSTLDRRRARGVIESAARELERADAELAALRRELAACAERERARLDVGGRSRSVAEVGRWAAAQDPELGFVPDPVPPGADLPLDPGELAELYRLAALPAADRDAVALRRPDHAAFPPGVRLRALRGQVAAADAELRALRGHAASRIAPSLSTKGLDAIAARVERVAERHARVTTDWVAGLSDELRRSAPSRAFWKEFGAFVDAGVAELYELSAVTGPHELVLPAGPPPRTLAAHLTAVRDRLARGKRLRRPRLRLTAAARERVAVIDGCQVDGGPLRTLADAELLLAAARAASRRGELVVAWNREMTKAGGPRVDPDDPDAERAVDREHGALRAALTFEHSDWPELRERLTWAGVQIGPTPSVEELDRLRQDVVLARARLTRQADERRALADRKDAQDELDRLRDLLAEGRAGGDASPLWGELAAALAHGDDAAWDDALATCARLDALAPAVARFDAQVERLRAAAPRWADRIITERGGPAAGDPARAADAWQLRQARTWLDRLVAAEDPAAVTERLAELQALRSQHVGDLVAWSTWLAAAERVTPDQRRALNGLLQALRRGRSGAGGDGARYHAIARSALQRCRPALAAWIMPAYRVVETFQPTPDEPLFDVLIVDEASQCDLRTLGLLGLARQAVVVGDDRQISPRLDADAAAVRALTGTHVPDLPNADLLDATASLYDVAKWTYPGVVMLREHFRCLPAIIGFSNELSYDGEILPLREAPAPDPGEPAWTWQPLRAVRVPAGAAEGGVNDAEARAIAEQVAACCAHPAYEGRTMGVISLLGEAQARHVYHLLLERLGERELAARRLVCGDAYRFQGDERDVVFLSMVAAAGTAAGPPGDAAGALTGVADRQRLNVAASRARDQLWLFHSLDAADLDPDDVRGRLLRYCQDAARVSAAGERPDDGAEPALVAAVRAELRTRGYRVRSRVRVGHHTIDLVIAPAPAGGGTRPAGGAGTRLAVECLGESGRPADRFADDERRQVILERLGWRFHHLRGSAWYRDPEAALAPLLRRLEGLGIEPAGGEGAGSRGGVRRRVLGGSAEPPG